MKPIYYIDGNNLLHFWDKTGYLIKKGQYRQAQKILIEKIKHSPLMRKSSFEIFFDGEVPSYSFATGPAKVKLTFCYPDTADSRIEEKLRLNYQRNLSIIVVSNDHEVQKSARRYDFKSISNLEFIEKIEAFEHKKKYSDEEGVKTEIHEKDIEKWLKIFEKGNNEEVD